MTPITNGRSKIAILHLSDMHLRGSEDYLQDRFQAVARAVQNETIDLGAAIVVISGDVVWSGSTDQFTFATTSLFYLKKELLGRLKLSDVSIFAVPGNHDCDFESSQGVRDVLIKDLRSNSPNAVDGDVIEACCSVQQNFFAFLRRNNQPAAHEGKTALLGAASPSRSFCVLFRCYNTAWLSKLKEETGSLFYPVEIAERLATDPRADFRVAIFHHPYNWLPPNNHTQPLSVDSTAFGLTWSIEDKGS